MKLNVEHKIAEFTQTFQVAPQELHSATNAHTELSLRVGGAGRSLSRSRIFTLIRHVMMPAFMCRTREKSEQTEWHFWSFNEPQAFRVTVAEFTPHRRHIRGNIK